MRAPFGILIFLVVVVVAVALAGCRSPSAAERVSGANGANGGNGASVARDAPDTWTYDVEVTPDGPGGPELRVNAELSTAERAELHVDSSAESFIANAAMQGRDGGWRSVASDRLVCEPPRCRVRYQFRLDAAARALRDHDTVTEFGGAYATSASAWLAHPPRVKPRAYRVHVIPAGRAVLSGMAPAHDGAADTYEARGVGLDDAPYFAFGAWRAHSTTIESAKVTVAIAPGTLKAMRDEEMVARVHTAGSALATYLQSFPTPHPLLLIVPGNGDQISGMTLGGGGGAILLSVGPNVSPAIARENWVLTHEMVHLEMPMLGYMHAWLAEGLATYLEPIVRVRAGEISAERMWGDVLQDAAQGLPEPGDEGLERTHTWGRTYWGGAIFYLLADVTIRERTKNAHSLDDALRAVARASAGVADSWSVERFLDTADKATTVTVFRELYDRLGFAPGKIDLPALWARLGLSLRNGQVVFDDKAPLASVRRGIAGR